MERWICIAGIALCTWGCAADDPPPPRLASKPCAAVAAGKMADARVNGQDGNAQRIVFRYYYADCVKWEAKGYEPPSP